MDLNMRGKRALVTGASMGIGLETARSLAREGVEVMICARREEVLAAAARDVRESTGKAVATHCLDVTNLDGLTSLASTIDSKLGGLDYLVNNAGAGTYKPFLEVTEEDLQYAMAINFFGPFRICQKVVPLMLRQGRGHVMNIGGVTGLMVMSPPFLSTCSGPAKAAEIRFTKTLAHELAPHNIRVNCIVPGLVMTPEHLVKWEKNFTDGPLTDEGREKLHGEWMKAQGMPSGRWGTAEEIAALVTFALSDVGGYVNGAVIVADGGMSRS